MASDWELNQYQRRVISFLVSGPAKAGGYGRFPNPSTLACLQRRGLVLSQIDGNWLLSELGQKLYGG